MNIYKAYENYWARARRNCVTPLSVIMRRGLDHPGFQRLILPPIEEGGNPIQIWVEWGNRVTKRYGCRLPGNWKTARGIKKRQRALHRVSPY